MRGSIRRTFLLWVALVLIAALGTFAWGTWSIVQRALHAEVDAELEGTAELLAATVARPPRESRRPRGGPRRRPRPEDPRPRSEDAPPPRIPKNLIERLDEGRDAGVFFVAWNVNGGVIESRHAPEGITRPRPLEAGEVLREQVGSVRRVSVSGPRGSAVTVGRSIRVEEERLRRLAWSLIAIGSALLLVALVGTWWGAGRALRPIARMTATAETISATHLDERIELTSARNELDRLARVLNGAFDRLQRAFERQSQFTADASHELRTPLAVIASETEFALSRERQPEEYRASLESCQRASDRMRQLVDGLLLLARVEGGDDVVLTRVQFDEVVQAAVDLVVPLARDRRIELVSQLVEVSVHGDTTRLSHAVTNLLVNAVRYNRDEGRVEVVLGREEGQAVLEVSDTGIGIAEEHAAEIFERFYRVDRARSRKGGGSGLGLAIVAEVVRQHGGTVACRSEPGVGSTFTLRLPLAERQSSE